MSESHWRWKAFQKELDYFALDKQVITEVHIKDIDVLTSEFTQLRERSRTELGRLIRNLKKQDPDNPAFLSVSLLGLLHGTGLRETAHTRLLAWFFDPEKAKHEHGLPETLFISVLEWIRSEYESDWPEGEYVTITIEAEKYTRDGNRIDLWIEGKVIAKDKSYSEWLVVIEAKVEANLSKEQLKPYETEAKNWKNKNKNRLAPCFIYLKDGTDADVNNRNNNWNPMSFVTLVEILWPKIKSAKITNSLQYSDGYHLARYYLAGILSDIEGWTLPLKVSNGGFDYQKIDFARSLTLNGGVSNE